MDSIELVKNFKNWVVIGDVLNEKKYANKILKRFKRELYNVSGVHPRGGDGVYKTLKEVAQKIEAIDLCINPIQGIEYVKEAHTLGIKYILIQPGAESSEILEFCKKNDMVVVEGCALVAFALI